MSEYCQRITKHYEAIWHGRGTLRRWDKGPVGELPADFCVIEFAPTMTRNMWTYATCCMSQPGDARGLEMHLFSPVQSDAHVELLTVLVHYHRTGATLGLGHTVNFGRPWLDSSACSFGLLSRPYLDGPKLEEMQSNTDHISFLWLIPITKEERDYKKQHGLEALEEILEQSKFNYLNPNRGSVV